MQAQPPSPEMPRDPSPAPVVLGKRAKFVATPIAIVWATVPMFGGFAALYSVASLREWLTSFGHSFGGTGWWIYVGLFSLLSGLGLLPTYAMSAVGGWVFGSVAGTTGAIAGFVGGAMLGFVITKLAAGEAFEQWLDAKPKARVIRRAFVERGLLRTLGLVILLRFPPNSPFSITNFVMTASGVRFLPYIVGTAIGMAPRTAIVAVMAATAAATGEENFQSLFEKRRMELFIGIGITLVVLFILSQIGQAALRRAGLDDRAELNKR